MASEKGKEREIIAREIILLPFLQEGNAEFFLDFLEEGKTAKQVKFLHIGLKLSNRGENALNFTHNL